MKQNCPPSVKHPMMTFLSLFFCRWRPPLTTPDYEKNISRREGGCWKTLNGHWAMAKNDQLEIANGGVSRFQYLMQILQVNLGNCIPKYQIFVEREEEVDKFVQYWQEPTTLWDGQPVIGFMAETYSPKKGLSAKVGELGSHIARESLLEFDASLVIATSGLRTNLLLQEPPFRKPPIRPSRTKNSPIIFAFFRLFPLVFDRFFCVFVHCRTFWAVCFWLLLERPQKMSKDDHDLNMSSRWHCVRGCVAQGKKVRATVRLALFRDTLRSSSTLSSGQHKLWTVKEKNQKVRLFSSGRAKKIDWLSIPALRAFHVPLHRVSMESTSFRPSAGSRIICLIGWAV